MTKPNAQSQYNVQIYTTADGSHSLRIPGLDELYHSKHSAIAEARHVYIEAGIHHCLHESPNEELHIFEMGFGTGLNALMCAIEAEALKQSMHLKSIEKYPVGEEVWQKLNYLEFLQYHHAPEWFEKLHMAPWQQSVRLNEYFSFEKCYGDFLTVEINMNQFDLMLWDAFGFRAQEELWSVEVFQKCFRMLRSEGVLVTYASKGLVRRNMEAAGFDVQKLPGPPGKREMVRATKHIVA